ncbi:hypothetical protein ACDT16_13930, partial [Staphylococcus aureus]
ISSGSEPVTRPEATISLTPFVPAATVPNVIYPMTPISAAEDDEYTDLILETFYTILARGVKGVLEKNRTFLIAKNAALAQLVSLQTRPGQNIRANVLEASLGQNVS